MHQTTPMVILAATQAVVAMVIPSASTITIFLLWLRRLFHPAKEVVLQHLTLAYSPTQILRLILIHSEQAKPHRLQGLHQDHLQPITATRAHLTPYTRQIHTTILIKPILQRIYHPIPRVNHQNREVLQITAGFLIRLLLICIREPVLIPLSFQVRCIHNHHILQSKL